MPFATRTNNRRRFRRRPLTRRRQYGRRAPAVSAMRMVRRMLPKPEKKYFDQVMASSTITTTATLTPLDGISNGTNENQRIGSRVTVVSFFSRLSMTVNSIAGANFLRVIYFYYKATQGSTPSVGNILQNTSRFDSPLNDDYSQNFKVIHDKTYALAVGSDSLQVDKYYRKLHLTVEYDSSTSTTSNKNSLFALYLSDQGTNGPLVSDYIRLRYVDS